MSRCAVLMQCSSGWSVRFVDISPAVDQSIFGLFCLDKLPWRLTQHWVMFAPVLMGMTASNQQCQWLEERTRTRLWHEVALTQVHHQERTSFRGLWWTVLLTTPAEPAATWSSWSSVDISDYWYLNFCQTSCCHCTNKASTSRRVCQQASVSIIRKRLRANNALVEMIRN